MDAVKVFDVALNLDEVSRLYDYGRGAYVEKPPEGWDKLAIAEAYRQAIASINDETTESIVKRMYPTLGEKGTFETNAETSGDNMVFEKIDDDSSTASLPQLVLPVLKPGDDINGHVILEVLEPMEAVEIKLKLKGMASTNLRYYHNKGYYDNRGYEVYVKEKKSLWRKSGSDDVDQEYLVDSALQTGEKLAPGKYEFPFSFRLPENCPQSTPPMVKSCADWAHLAYYIKATISKGKNFKRGNIVTNRGLWVEKATDIGAFPEHLVASTEEQSMETGLITKGKITCRATLPARAFIRGNDNHVPLKLEVDNQSGGAIDGVKARVMLKGVYRSSSGKWHGTRSFKYKGAKVMQGTIDSGMCPCFNMQVPLNFREAGVDGNLVPAGRLTDCGIIDCSYEVSIVLKRKGLHRNMEMEIPIEIGTENSKEELYPSLGGLSLN